ncbi:hypothetical protein ONE63_003842 [Megalurothrips usitatus]|uniref:Uncharacterized protein n=1 Tax=Megalurothrips usitatus TaxID=439358 RepID=A0AAV7X8I5_9NEOP|nr:hypothetical protein ONE63_003842 [Megalurothrips usitatus]
MNLGRQTLSLLVRCRKTLRPTLSASPSQRCLPVRNLGRLLSNNNVSDRTQLSSVPQPPTPDVKSLPFESDAGAEYLRLVKQKTQISASWENAAFVFSLVQALRLAVAHLGSQKNPDLELLVSFLLHLKLEIDAANKNDTLRSRRQLPRKIVKLPDHYFINEPDGKEPKVQIFPDVPFYLSPAVAAKMQQKSAHLDWKEFVVFFLHEIYGEDLLYLTALGKKNTQGIHPLIFKGLVAFALEKDDTISEVDVISLINQTSGTEKIRFMRSQQRRKASLKGSGLVKNRKYRWITENKILNQIELPLPVQNCDPSGSSIGAEYVPLVEREIRLQASMGSVAFMNNILSILRDALTSEKKTDLEILVSFLNALVFKAAIYAEEKEALRCCKELPDKIVKLPDHYFVNKQVGKVPKVQIFPGVPFYVSPALASIMEERKTSWTNFVATFVEQIYGDDMIYLSASVVSKGGKQLIHPLILKGLIDFSRKEDKSIEAFDVVRKLNEAFANKRRIVARKNKAVVFRD